LSSTRNQDSLIQHAAGLYQRFRHTIHEGAKFLIVGLAGIAVTNLVFIPLHGPLGLGPLTSVTIATIVATVVTFLGNRYWSFRGRQGDGAAREGVTFFVLNGVGLLIQYAVLGFTNYVLGLDTKAENVLAVNLGIGLGTLFRFWSYRKWVWVPEHERLARLRRGRHRRGREAMPVSPPAPASALAPPGHRPVSRPGGASSPLPRPAAAASAQRRPGSLGPWSARRSRRAG
jgi:putative flippase GtrA